MLPDDALAIGKPSPFVVFVPFCESDFGFRVQRKGIARRSRNQNGARVFSPLGPSAGPRVALAVACPSSQVVSGLEGPRPGIVGDIFASREDSSGTQQV